MSLKEYRAKRNFSVSPEPQGIAAPKARRARELFFCVQKHLASQLHYDFRLEHDGVLLSWAVPKGPSLDPKVKRLAMKVEDHPIEYGDFEGVIPDGYGMGIVMLWDRGSWEPLVDDVDAALKKGDLKLRLNGIKLKGSWALIRTGGDGRSWLLLKHRDEWAGPLDIATFAPLSIKSGGDLTDIVAAEAPAVWQSHRAAKAGGAGLIKIVERAVALQAERESANAAQTSTTEVGPNFSSANRRKSTAVSKAPGTAPVARMASAAGSKKKSPSTKAASTARSTPHRRAASGRAARSPAARSRPR
jgi:bifunctional non-homologous end joining protein LigD